MSVDIFKLLDEVERLGVEHTGNEPSLSCFHRTVDELRAQLEARGSAEPVALSKAELDRDLYRNCYNYYENVCERLVSEAERYVEALRLIACGEVMKGNYTHADTVLRYQDIARKAIESTSLLSAPTPPSAEQQKIVAPKPQSCCSYWRNEALEKAAGIADSHGNEFIAQDIRSMKRVKQPDSAAPEPKGFDGHTIIEEALKRANSGNLAEAPFPLVDGSARAWLAGAASAYQHALEMIPKPQRNTQQRITEQYARDIADSVGKFYKEKTFRTTSLWFKDEGHTLLDKLNEHREPNYKARADDLLSKLDYILDGLSNQIGNADLRNDSYDGGYLRAIKAEVSEVRTAIAKHEGGNK